MLAVEWDTCVEGTFSTLPVLQAVALLAVQRLVAFIAHAEGTVVTRNNGRGVMPYHGAQVAAQNITLGVVVVVILPVSVVVGHGFGCEV